MLPHNVCQRMLPANIHIQISCSKVEKSSGIDGESRIVIESIFFSIMWWKRDGRVLSRTESCVLDMAGLDSEDCKWKTFQIGKDINYAKQCRKSM